jgi:hypothetical protein
MTQRVSAEFEPSLFSNVPVLIKNMIAYIRVKDQFPSRCLWSYKSCSAPGFLNWVRAGDAYSANGAAEFIKECCSRLPKRVWKIIWRADSAFFDGKSMDVIRRAARSVSLQGEPPDGPVLAFPAASAGLGRD